MEPIAPRTIDVSREAARWKIVKYLSYGYIATTFVGLGIIVSNELIGGNALSYLTKAQIYSSILAMGLSIYATKKISLLKHDLRNPLTIFFYDMHSKGDKDALLIQGELDLLDRQLSVEEARRFKKAKERKNAS